MELTNIKVGIILSFIALTACGGGIVNDIPTKPDTSTKYIFYLHGSVEESKGHTEKYQAAVNAISTGSTTVISEIRGDTDPNTYAEKLKKQVNFLISKGVPANNITISGFSKGAVIAIAASTAVSNPEVNYVLLAGCSDFLNVKYGVHPHLAVGRILSIYDVDDEKFGSCSGFINSSEKVKFKEIELYTGKGHKLFRIPKEKFIEEWRNPLHEWAGI